MCSEYIGLKVSHAVHKCTARKFRNERKMFLLDLDYYLWMALNWLVELLQSPSTLYISRITDSQYSEAIQIYKISHLIHMFFFGSTGIFSGFLCRGIRRNGNGFNIKCRWDGERYYTYTHFVCLSMFLHLHKATFGFGLTYRGSWIAVVGGGRALMTGQFGSQNAIHLLNYLY